jgi:inorganic pyrophosphatase
MHLVEHENVERVVILVDGHDRFGNKGIAVATADPEYSEYHEARELPPHKLAMIRRFFQDYKNLGGKVVEADDILPAKTANR